MLELYLKEILTVISAGIAAVFWFARLEFVGKANKEQLEKMDAQIKIVSAKVEQTESKLEARFEVLRSEMAGNFANVNNTLQEVIFRLSDHKK